MNPIYHGSPMEVTTGPGGVVRVFVPSHESRQRAVENAAHARIVVADHRDHQRGEASVLDLTADWLRLELPGLTFAASGSWPTSNVRDLVRFTVARFQAGYETSPIEACIVEAYTRFVGERQSARKEGA